MSEETKKDERYISKINYPNLLYMRINDIHLAMNRGSYATVEVANLISTLKPTWVEELRAEIEKIYKEMDTSLDKIEKTHYIVSPNTFRGREKRIYYKSAQRVVNLIIGLMDKNGMLLIKERELMEYYEK